MVYCRTPERMTLLISWFLGICCRDVSPRKEKTKNGFHLLSTDGIRCNYLVTKHANYGLSLTLFTTGPLGVFSMVSKMRLPFLMVLKT